MSTAVVSSTGQSLTYWHDGIECCDAVWESAYAQFETPEEEIAKFIRRFRQLGVDRWPKSMQIAELFCGRGNGLVALDRLGFSNLHGADLAPSLLRQYSGHAKLFVADCRNLRFEDRSLDAVIIQGGLHHLPDVEPDLPLVLNEIKRILRPGGKVVVVEPWLTPFLRVVHFLARRSLVRRVSTKFHALQQMIMREQTTYDSWLRQPDKILTMIESRFVTERLIVRTGKLMFVGSNSAPE